MFKSELKPVVVFIPGGTFVVGSSEAQLYGPQILLERELVLVGANYRQETSDPMYVFNVLTAGWDHWAGCLWRLMMLLVTWDCMTSTWHCSGYTDTSQCSEEILTM